MPTDLRPDEVEIWHLWGDDARQQGTLTPETVAGFRLLCELEAERRRVRTQLDTDGRTQIRCTVDGSGQEHQQLVAHPLVACYGRLSKQVENMMARYLLVALAKPMPLKRRVDDSASRFFGGTAV